MRLWVEFEMFSITSAAQHLGLPRDTVLNAVRSGLLAAARDRRGILRIEPDAVHGFAASLPGISSRHGASNVVALNAMRPDRLSLVLSQHLPSPAAFRPPQGVLAPSRVVFLQTRTSAFGTARRLSAARRRIDPAASRGTTGQEHALPSHRPPLHDGIGPAA
jgi:excisionase family DNA binding protein